MALSLLTCPPSCPESSLKSSHSAHQTQKPALPEAPSVWSSVLLGLRVVLPSLWWRPPLQRHLPPWLLNLKVSRAHLPLFTCLLCFPCKAVNFIRPYNLSIYLVHLYPWIRNSICHILRFKLPVSQPEEAGGNRLREERPGGAVGLLSPEWQLVTKVRVDAQTAGASCHFLRSVSKVEPGIFMFKQGKNKDLIDP